MRFKQYLKQMKTWEQATTITIISFIGAWIGFGTTMAVIAQADASRYCFPGPKPGLRTCVADAPDIPDPWYHTYFPFVFYGSFIVGAALFAAWGWWLTSSKK
jgi:hypothetical protein